MVEEKKDRHTRSRKITKDEHELPKNRRRGEALQEAILQAAWDELAEVGYAHLTMEGVAARAKTNKAVLYRRWPNKGKLVIAVLHVFKPKPSYEVPDTGNLQNDLFVLLQGIVQPLRIIGAKTMHGLMVDHLGADIIPSLPQLMHPVIENKMITAIKTVLKNGELRGELDLENFSPRVLSLPLDLLRYEILITHEPISDETISEIIDDIFMPLVRGLRPS